MINVILRDLKGEYLDSVELKEDFNLSKYLNSVIEKRGYAVSLSWDIDRLVDDVNATGMYDIKKILLLDDDPKVLKLLVKAVQQKGHHAVGFTSPEQAYHSIKTESNGFEYAICDFRMPNMTGDLFIKEAKRFSPDTHYVILTGYDGDFDNDDLEVSVYKKPIDLTTFFGNARVNKGA